MVLLLEDGREGAFKIEDYSIEALCPYPGPAEDCCYCRCYQLLGISHHCRRAPVALLCIIAACAFAGCQGTRPSRFDSY